MNNSLRCLFTVSALLAACSGGSGTGSTPGNATGAFAGAGLPPAAGTDGSLIVPMSMVIPKKQVTPVVTTTSPGGAAGARAPGQGFPGTGAPGAMGAMGAMGAPGSPGAQVGPGATGAPGFPGAGAAGGGAMMSMAAAGSGAGAVTAEPSAMGDRATPEGVCARWKADRVDLSEGMWTGDVASCNAGDMDPKARATALRVLNLYRWLADMPTMTTDPTKDKQAQSCALLQRANNSLSHMPPTSWTCYMEEGAMASGRCNISSGPAVSSVDGYMIDPGNDTTIGHRRWILSNSMGPTGIGGTDRASCLMTTGNMRVNKAWQAWPAPGIIPIQAMSQGIGQWSQNIDMTGWTVQSDTINLTNAQVTVTANGMPQPVTVTQLQSGYGSRYAFRFNPMGWKTTAGTTYTVEVTGAPMPIKYDVQIVDCK